MPHGKYERVYYRLEDEEEVDAGVEYEARVGVNIKVREYAACRADNKVGNRCRYPA